MTKIFLGIIYLVAFGLILICYNLGRRYLTSSEKSEENDVKELYYKKAITYFRIMFTSLVIIMIVSFINLIIFE